MSLYQLTTIDKLGNEITVIKKGPIKIFPEKDGIVFSHCKRFKYNVKTNYTIGIAKVGNKKYIIGHSEPGWLECHPDTELCDINVIKNTLNECKVKDVEKPKQWIFKSSSSDSEYKVTQYLNKLKCDCPGFWRSKGRCKHVKEVEKNL